MGVNWVTVLLGTLALSAVLLSIIRKIYEKEKLTLYDKILLPISAILVMYFTFWLVETGIQGGGN